MSCYQQREWPRRDYNEYSSCMAYDDPAVTTGNKKPALGGFLAGQPRYQIFYLSLKYASFLRYSGVFMRL